MMGRATKPAETGDINSASVEEEFNIFFRKFNFKTVSGNLNLDFQTNNEELIMDEQLVTSILQNMSCIKSLATTGSEDGYLKAAL